MRGNWWNRLEIVLWLLAFAAAGGLLYWLLPVTPQSLSSADSVRWAFSETGGEPTAPGSLNSLWVSLLLGLKLCMRAVGAAPAEAYAWAAALNGWLSVIGVGMWLRSLVPQRRGAALLALGLVPAFLWSAVVPSGSGLTVALLGASALLRPWRWRAVCVGVASALSPAAWIVEIFLLRQARAEERRQQTVFLALGFLVPVALAGAMGLSTFALIPALQPLFDVVREDVLAAARVFGLGRGAVAIQLAAEVALAALLTIGLVAQTTRRFVGACAALLVLSLGLTAGQAAAWRMAHPGWNTVLADAARNVVTAVPPQTLVDTPSPTEAAAARFFLEVTAPAHRSKALKIVDRKNLAATDAVGQPPAVWLPTLPEQDIGLTVSFLGYGVLMQPHPGPTRFVFDREALQRTYVAARPSLREYRALVPKGSAEPLEFRVFERYGIYHLASARVLEREKQPADWERRRNAEVYAALRKVEWSELAFHGLCVNRSVAAPAEELCRQIAAGSDKRYP